MKTYTVSQRETYETQPLPLTAHLALCISLCYVSTTAHSLLRVVELAVGFGAWRERCQSLAYSVDIVRF